MLFKRLWLHIHTATGTLSVLLPTRAPTHAALKETPVPVRARTLDAKPKPPIVRDAQRLLVEFSDDKLPAPQRKIYDDLIGWFKRAIADQPANVVRATKQTRAGRVKDPAREWLNRQTEDVKNLSPERQRDRYITEHPDAPGGEGDHLVKVFRSLKKGD